jgi:hypothetical protein
MLNASSIVFYHTFSGGWDSGGTGTDQYVDATAVVSNGTEESVLASQAEFLVQRPAVTDNSYSYGQAEVAVQSVWDPSIYWLSFGDQQDPYFAQTAGIYYNWSATFPSGFDGEIGVTQLANNATTWTDGPDPTSSPLAGINTAGSYELDTCLQYSDPVSGTGSASWNLDTTTIAYDAPAVPLISNDYSTVTTDQSFDTYYLYKPNLPNSIWVTLNRVEWNWDGTAGNEPPWELTSYDPPGYESFLALELPVWTAVENLDFPTSRSCPIVS